MKKAVLLILWFLVMPAAMALNQFVTLTLNSFQDMAGSEMALQVFDWGNGFYCVDGTCVRITSMLKAGYTQTQGPFNFNPGLHQAKIRIEGDNDDRYCDVRLFDPATQRARAWRATMIDEAFCPLNRLTFWNDDFRSCGQLNVFSGSATNPAYYSWAGYGDVDDCTDGRFEWVFDFNI